MVERDVAVDKYRFTYEGIFDASELYRFMDTYFEEKNYDKKEIKNIEVVKESGKFIDLEIEPYKKYTDYFKNVIHIRIIITDLKDIEVEREGVKVKLNHGKLQLICDAYAETDYENRWETKPMFYFIRMLYHKYIYSPYTMMYHGTAKGELMAFVSQVKAFLNVYRQYK